MLPALITSVAIPIILDLIKSAAPALSRKLLGVSVDEQIKLDSASVERLKALASLDNPYGEVSKWVANLRGSFRYLAAAGLIVGGLVVVGLGVVQTQPEIVALGIDLASSPFGFIFGERLVLAYKGSPK